MKANAVRAGDNPGPAPSTRMRNILLARRSMRSDERGGEVSWIGAAVPYDYGDAILPESFSSERIAPVAMLRRMLRQVDRLRDPVDQP